MRIKMTHIGGPLDGSIEFDEGTPYPKKFDNTYLLARGTFELSNGEVGKGAVSAGPASMEARAEGILKDEDAARSTLHHYCVISNEVIEGVRHVTAVHKPEYRS